MGLELILGAASLAVGVISASSAQSAQRKSVAAQKKAQAISLAQSKVESRESRRQLLREERIRRARLMQGAFNAGTSGSSGEIGAGGAMTTNVDSSISFAAGQSKANEGINLWNQKAMDFDQKAREALAWGEVFQSGFSSANDIFSK
jgi:hypothetical protein